MSAVTAPRVLVEHITTAWVRDIVMIGGATAVIALSAQIAIPLPFSPVPLTLQTLAVLLASASLGAWRSISATTLYFGLALAGFPVLAPQADGSHVTGIQILSLPSLGYVLGFIVAAFVVGRLSEAGWSAQPGRTTITMVLGNLTIYAIGVPTLAVIAGVDLLTAAQWGLIPFLIGDAIKIAFAAGLLPTAWKLVHRTSDHH
jgi:biotin transport system substrate-specific component